SLLLRPPRSTLFPYTTLFRSREHYRFDPGSAWNLELLVRRQTGPVQSIFTSFEMPYLMPEDYIEHPPLTAEELAAIEEANRPLWVNIWYQKSFQIGVLCAALGLLTIIMFLQDKFTQRPQFLH